jgi:hypothetical protein
MIASRYVRGVVAVFAVLMAIAGCAPPPEAIASAVPSPETFLRHLRPSDLGREVEAVQLVTVGREGQAVTVEMRVSVRAGRLMLVSQDMLGQRLMTVRWDETGVIAVERSPNLPPVVSPEGLLADMVAIGWPEREVRRALAQAGAMLEAHGNRRIISEGHRETMQATLGWMPDAPWTGRLNYRNVRAGYTVDVQSVQQQ